MMTLLMLCRVLMMMVQIMTRTSMVFFMFCRVLCNKPVRPAMVSTLQQRWAATGGMPPQ